MKEIARVARFTRDVAPSLRDLVAETPEDGLAPEQWDTQLQPWRDWHAATRDLRASLDATPTFSAGSGLAINTTVSGFLSHPSRFQGPQVPPKASVEEAKTRLFRTLDRFPQMETVKAAFHRLGLNVRGGTARVPGDLLDEAQGALDVPGTADGRPASVLLPLRECIDATVSELIKRRPRQEPSPGWAAKVASVGLQCGQEGLQPYHFLRLGDDASKLLNELSGFKQEELPRDEVLGYFHRGLLFLNAFLDALDETKVRTI